ELAHRTLRLQQNTVLLDGRVLSPNDYVPEIVNGFREMYRFLVQHRAALLDPSGPLAALAGQPVRFIFRPTRIYGHLLAACPDRESLRDGAERSIDLDILSRPLLSAEAPNPFWPLRRDEQEALERLDIPFFATPAGSDGLPLPSGEVIPYCFTASAY